MKNNKLRGKIIEKCGSIAEFSNALGITKGTASKKICGANQWTVQQICDACEILELPMTRETFRDYFKAVA